MEADGNERIYGSDVAVAAMAKLGIEYAALNPGASFRGLHDSLVHAGTPRPVLCLAENVVVALAHGYAKSSGKPMAAVLHNLVGLQAGSMGLFNAWIDQAPMLVLGGSGPADRTRRRPYMDWIHTANPQVNAVRAHVKWDDEPATIAEWPESLARAVQLAVTEPAGPTYVALDALLQEEPIEPDSIALIGQQPAPRAAVPQADLEHVVALLRGASKPLIIADYLGRSADAFEALVRVAELTGARVVDIGGRLSFPSTHPADASDHRLASLREADLVLALDVRDLRWVVTEEDERHRGYRPVLGPDVPVVSIGLEAMETRRVTDREGVVDGAIRYLGDSGVVLPVVAELLEHDGPRASAWDPVPPRTGLATPEGSGETVTRDQLAAATWQAVREGPWQLAHNGLKRVAHRHWGFSSFNAHLGGSGGGGLGYGAGAAIGAALAQRGSDVLVVSHQPDGDLLYTPSALWTAANESLPMLMVVVNNRSYGQDRMHQELVARTRGRPEEYARVGIDITDPAIDIAQLAGAQGVMGFGPVSDPAVLAPTLQRAASIARDERRPVVVDVVMP